MRHSLAYCVGSLALLLFGNVCQVKGDSGDDAKKSRGQEIKEAIEANNGRLPIPATNVLRDASQLNWKEAFSQTNYRLRYSAEHEHAGAAGKFTVRTMNWDLATGSQGRSVTLFVVFGDSSHTEARDRLFEVMGAKTNMVIRQSVYTVLKDGPGDLCIVSPGHLTKGSEQPKVLHKLWFVRDNVGVELSCPRDTDLYPIAKAADKVIRACPEKTKSKVNGK